MKKHQLIDEAKQFIYQCYSELGLSKEIQEKRINDITKEIQETGSYDHTKVELEHGAKMAWRNSNRCIGRLLWQTLEVFDAREVTKAEEAYEHLLKHISFATNGGKNSFNDYRLPSSKKRRKRSTHTPTKPPITTLCRL